MPGSVDASAIIFNTTTAPAAALGTGTATDGFVLTATGVGLAPAWEAAAGGSNAFGTIAVSGQSDVVADAGGDTLTLVGSGVTITTNAGTDTITFTASGSSDLVYAAAGADTAINSVTDITIVTRDVTSVGATDILDVTADFVILNTSGATRIYVLTLDFDGLFDVEFTTGALATSATLMHPFTLRGVLGIRSTSLAYATFVCEGQLAAGIASGTDTTMAATHLRASGWGTTASNATGTTTVALKIRSANATATQTCRLLNFQVRKATPTA